jgi:tryptophanyl-tRNA synthetase
VWNLDINQGLQLAKQVIIVASMIKEVMYLVLKLKDILTFHKVQMMVTINTATGNHKEV